MRRSIPVSNLVFWLCSPLRVLRVIPFRVLFRAVGLGILVWLRGRPEPRKVLFTKSRRLALARCAVHILPVLVSMVVIGNNMGQYFIGKELKGAINQDSLKIAWIQVAAKIQELLMIASMTVIILHDLRWQLVFGEGVPLGLIGAGWSFTQVSYLWSVDFYCGVRETFSGRHVILLRRLRFLVVLLFGSVVALLGGPATAVLMVPRVIDFPAGGGIFWLNGSSAQLWPATMTSNHTHGYECHRRNAHSDPMCPGGSFEQLYSHYSRWRHLPNGPVEFEIQDSLTRRMFYSVNSWHGNIDSWVYTTHSATARAQDVIRTRHISAGHELRVRRWNGLDSPADPANLYDSNKQRYEVQTRLPLVRVSCREAAKNVTLSSVNRLKRMNVPFPILPEFGRKGRDKQVDVRSAVLDILTNRGYRSSLPLLGNATGALANQSRQYQPILVFPRNLIENDAASLGLVVLRLENSTFQNTTGTKLSHVGVYNMATCSVDARWAKGSSIIENGDPNIHEHKTAVRTVVKAGPACGELQELRQGKWRPPDDGSVSRVTLQADWFQQKLSPPLSSAHFVQSVRPGGSSQAFRAYTTSVEALLWLMLDPSRGGPRQGFTDRNPHKIPHILKSMEDVIAVLVADGLSHHGLAINRNISQLIPGPNWFYSAIQQESETLKTMVRRGHPAETFPRPEFLADNTSERFVMRAYFGGYAIAAQDGFDFFSIALLILHALFALVHTCLVFYHGETSDSWDTVAELVALASTSPPPDDPVLENTSAGIRTMRSVRRTAWVEAARPGDTPAGSEELRLRFEEIGGGGRDMTRVPDVRVEYGSI